MVHSNQPLLNSIPLDLENENVLGKLSIRLTCDISALMVLKSAIELNILEIIAEAGDDAFVSTDHIAAELSSKNPNASVLLDRMLSLLACHSIVKCSTRKVEDGQHQRLYGLGPVSKYFLKKEGERSVAALFVLTYDKVFMDSWYHLNDVILEGGIPFDRAYGKSVFEYIGTDPRFNLAFNEGMSSLTKLIMKKILDVYKGFEDVQVLVDVGGGIGSNLNLIISKYPKIKGINYDLPHAIAAAPSYSGVEHVGGDMFASVPQGDAIFVKSVLHDWSDDHCLKILKNCYDALPNLGKVIIVDLIRPEIPESHLTSNFNVSYYVDIFMLAQCDGGMERTHKDFEKLALKSGFSSCEVKSYAYDFGIIEFHKNE